MATFRDRNSTQAWEIVSNGITRKGSVQGLMYVSNEYTGSLVYNYNQNKNYQIITGVTGSNPISAALSLKFSSPFKNSVITKSRKSKVFEVTIKNTFLTLKICNYLACLTLK